MDGLGMAAGNLTNVTGIKNSMIVGGMVGSAGWASDLSLEGRQPEHLVMGFLMSVLSMVFNGSFSSFGKLCKSEPDPIIFNTLVTYGALLLSLVVPIFRYFVGDAETIEYKFTGWGAVAGSLFVGATLFSFIAIPLAGLAMSAATWSASAICVAFLWGAIGPTSPPRADMKSTPLSILAVLLLLGGVMIINTSGLIGRTLAPEDTEAEIAEAGTEEAGTEEASNSVDEGKDAKPKATLKALGLASAMTVGIFGGSVLVPATYVRDDATGLNLLPSFGLGAAVTGTIIGVIYVIVQRPPLSTALRPEVIRNGMLAGATWNLGNICQIFAQNRDHLPYGIAYPIYQCALVVGGIWGIYYFKEERHCAAIGAFWMGSLVVIVGVVLLGLYGPGA